MTEERKKQGEASAPALQPRLRLPFRRTRRLVVSAALLVVAYIAITFVQVLLASRWDETNAADSTAEAAIVLGAAQYNGRPSQVFQHRLDRAYRLWEDGVVPRIVVTGGAAEGDRYTEAYSGLTYLRGRGVPEDDLIVVDDGASTWESLAASGRVLRNEGIEEVVLVSDPYHSFRLKGIANEVGLSATVAPTDTSGSLRQVARETAAVSMGRIIGYRRMLNWIG